MNDRLNVLILGGISLLLTGTLAGELLRNVALNRPASQSSGNGSATAGKAVDGDRDPDFNQGSCTLTNTEPNPWWLVDLRDVHKITAVVITNRKDGENVLDGAEVWIGRSRMRDGTKNFRCAVIPHFPSGRTLYVPCSAAEGRYVTVSLPGPSRVLSLCEVEVYPVDFAYPLPNVALKGEATQSSTHSFADASKAIDGSRNSFYSRGSCSHTAGHETEPWWRVDLQRTYTVSSVKVTNRGDCCADRLDGAEIRIGNSLENNGNNNSRCAFISHIRAGKTYTYRCDGGSMTGRFVNIVIPGKRKTLNLCEVEVYAVPEVKPLPNVALNKQTAQRGSNLLSSYAVNGCQNRPLFSECCARTLVMSNPWWRVDLSAVHQITAVTIINEKQNLMGAQIRIGSSRTSPGKILCVQISSLEETTIHTFHCADIKGRFVHIIIPGDSKILTLCEVEVYASLPEKRNPEPHSVSITPLPTPPVPPIILPTDSKLLSGKTLTVVEERLCWSDALYYCRRHHWDLLSLRSKEEMENVEQLLSRSPLVLTDSIWLGLRRYIMQDKWFWMSGDSMNFSRWRKHSAHNPCGSMVRGERHLWEDRSCEQYLNFICQSRTKDAAQRVFFYSTRQPLLNF